jgi:hypothetical protein
MPVRLAEYRAWNEACAASGLSCDGLSRPTVIRDNYGIIRGTFGFFKPGLDAIFITSNLHPDVEYATMAHEFTHYIEWNVAEAAGSADDITVCEAEGRAFRVSDAIFHRLHLDAYSRDGDLRDYGCVTPKK